MPQAHKKASAAKSAQHRSAQAAKQTKTPFSHFENTQTSAKSVVNIGADTMKELFSNTAAEAQKTHAKVFAVSREGTEAVSRTLDAFTRTLNDFVSLSRENIDVAVEVSNLVTDIARTANSELIKFSNNNFADNLDLLNETFNCRNINDALELSNKWASSNLDNFFSQSERFSEMLFQFANEASEPVNDHILESAERLGKTLAA